MPGWFASFWYLPTNQPDGREQIDWAAPPLPPRDVFQPQPVLYSYTVYIFLSIIIRMLCTVRIFSCSFPCNAKETAAWGGQWKPILGYSDYWEKIGHLPFCAKLFYNPNSKMSLFHATFYFGLGPQKNFDCYLKISNKNCLKCLLWFILKLKMKRKLKKCISLSMHQKTILLHCGGLIKI